MKKYKILFIDLDGTLIEPYTKNTFAQGIWDMKFKFDVWDKIKEINPNYVFIVTNQGGIGKFVSQDDFECKLEYVARSLKSYCTLKNVDCMYCASMNKNDEMRKPNTGMLTSCVLKYGCLAWAHREDMCMIGDASGLPGQFSDSDKKCAENYGIDYYDVNEFIKL